MGMTLRENQREYYFYKLDQHFIGIKEKYIKYYGDKYNCIVPNYKRLYKVFTDECIKYGILYDMKDIIKAYKKEIKSNEQITLFQNDKLQFLNYLMKNRIIKHKEVGNEKM